MALSTNHSNGASESQSGRTVTLSAGQSILEAAPAKATQVGVPMNIAVVDEGSNLVAFARMDDAWLGSIDIAQNKAYTARAFNMPTKDLAPLAQPGGPLYGIEASNHGLLIVFAGGIPLISAAAWSGRSVSAAAPSSRTRKWPKPARPPSLPPPPSNSGAGAALTRGDRHCSRQRRSAYRKKAQKKIDTARRSRGGGRRLIGPKGSRA